MGRCRGDAARGRVPPSARRSGGEDCLLREGGLPHHALLEPPPASRGDLCGSPGQWGRGANVTPSGGSEWVGAHVPRRLVGSICVVPPNLALQRTSAAATAPLF